MDFAWLVVVLIIASFTLGFIYDRRQAKIRAGIRAEQQAFKRAAEARLEATGERIHQGYEALKRKL